MQKREDLEFCNISFGCNCCNCELYVFVYFNFISNHEEQEAEFLQRDFQVIVVKTYFSHEYFESHYHYQSYKTEKM